MTGEILTVERTSSGEATNPEDATTDTKSQPVRTDFTRLLDSALLVAIATGLMFYWGYSYYEGFYGRLSFGRNIPLDSAPKYVVTTANIVVGAFFTVAVARPYMRYIHANPRTRVEAFDANGFILFFVIGLMVWSGTRFFDWVVITALGVLVLLIILATLARMSVLHIWDKDSRTVNLTFGVVFAIILAELLFTTHGRVDATKLIEGNSNEASTIVFDMRDDSSQFEGNRYGLVEHREGHYYFVEIADPAPKRPQLFVVADTEVRSAVIRRMDEDAMPESGATPAPSPLD